MRRPLLLALLVLAGCRPSPAPVPVPVPHPTPVPAPVPTPVPSPTWDASAALMYEHNARRASAGLPPFRMSEVLTKSAQSHADYMAKVGKMQHYGIGDGDPWARATNAGYAWSKLGENIAWNQDDVATVLRDWMGSPGHRANILGSYRDFGGATARGADGSAYWCTVFGSPTATR